MMQVVQQWKVVLDYPNRAPVEFWISDNFAVSVLRKISDLQFTANGLEQPVRITVSLK